MNEIYVILINGVPYRKDSAIRTYMTRERANKEALRLVEYADKYEHWRGKRVETAVFGTVLREGITV